MASLTPRRNYDAPVTRSALSGGRWDPFRAMEELLRWEPQFEVAPRQKAATFLPAFEVRETQDGYVFHADLPGVKEADLDISVTGQHLTISGKREEESRKEEGATYYAYERAYGSFTRAFMLPRSADVENVRAELKDGVLTLVVPKRPETKARKIEVSGATRPSG